MSEAKDGEFKKPFFAWFRPPARVRQTYSISVAGEGPVLKMQSESEGMENDADFTRLFSDPAVRHDFSTLAGLSNSRPAELAEMLWKEVWLGKLTNDTFASLRHGIENNFKVPDATALMARGSRRRRHSNRAAFSMWKGSLPMAGNWMRIPMAEARGGSPGKGRARERTGSGASGPLWHHIPRASAKRAAGIRLEKYL